REPGAGAGRAQLAPHRLRGSLSRHGGAGMARPSDTLSRPPAPQSASRASVVMRRVGGADMVADHLGVIALAAGTVRLEFERGMADGEILVGKFLEARLDRAGLRLGAFLQHHMRLERAIFLVDLPDMQMVDAAHALYGLERLHKPSNVDICRRAEHQQPDRAADFGER